MGKAGDFEAQRHWMEITINTPVQEWYVNTRENELSWWGLDYPPLSAYWAWFTGKIAKKFNRHWVSLYKSRRYESRSLKIYMRLTVLIADLLVLFPSLLWFFDNRSYSFIMHVWTFLTPSLLLIDHGHFQYNTLMLGPIVLAAVALLDYKRQLLATILVCLSFCFKQMGLYAVPAFAVFLLRHCIRQRKRGVLLFFMLGITAITSIAVYFAPFLIEPPKHLLPVLHRIFPLHRGLFEDKVSNFWCALAILTKFHQGKSRKFLVKLCAGILLTSLSPSLLSLLLSKPSGNRFLYSLAYTTLCFFMFAYHVHEKNILVPQIAVLLLSHLSPIFVFWFSCVSSLSLFMLMEKDHLEFYYFASITVWLLLSRRMYKYIRFSWTWRFLTVPTIIMMYALPLLQMTIPNPPRYPHLYHVLATLGCSASFMLSLLYLLYKQFTCESHYYYNRTSMLTTPPPTASSKPHSQ